MRTNFGSKKDAIGAACARVEKNGAQTFVWDHGAHVPRSRRYTIEHAPPSYGPFFGPIRRANLASYRDRFGIPAAPVELTEDERAYLVAAIAAYRSIDSERGPVLRPTERDELARKVEGMTSATSAPTVRTVAAYAVQGMVTTTSADGAWEGARQVPTFYLLPNVQGIMNHEHAAKVARSVVDPADTFAADDIHLTAVLVEL